MTYTREIDTKRREAGVSPEELIGYMMDHPVEFGPAIEDVARKKRFVVVGKNGVTCGHRHRHTGTAIDCLDTHADATCFCKHGIPVCCYCKKCGSMAVPEDSTGIWENPTIQAVV